jgi:Skp family chaperone for outer membrane proteins
MNQYVKDFGSKYGYTYIFGADGSGFLMYSLEANNITKEVKEYINSRYKGNTE